MIWLEFVLPRYGYRVGNGLPRRSHPRSPRMSGNSWVSSPEPLGDFRAYCGMSLCPFLWPPSVSLPTPHPGAGWDS